MEPLSRWLKKEDNPAGQMFVIFAIISAFLFLFSIGAAVYDTLTGVLPPEAYGVLAFLFILTTVLTVPAIKYRKNRRQGPSLSALHGAAFTGKLAKALGSHAETIGQAAADLEQVEALLKWGSLDEQFEQTLITSGNARMRRMVELSITPPGTYGLTLEQAARQIKEDGNWLAEVRTLVESTREESLPATKDETLTHLKEYVQAREEAVLELRA